MALLCSPVTLHLPNFGDRSVPFGPSGEAFGREYPLLMGLTPLLAFRHLILVAKISKFRGMAQFGLPQQLPALSTHPHCVACQGTPPQLAPPDTKLASFVGSTPTGQPITPLVVPQAPWHCPTRWATGGRPPKPPPCQSGHRLPFGPVEHHPWQ